MSYVYQNIIIGERLDVNPSAHIVTNAKGQLISDNGTKTTLQPAALTDNQFLISDSTQPTGLKWRTLTPTDLNIIAGKGLTLTENQIDIGSSTTIFANDDNVVVNSSAIANQPLLSSGTIGTAALYGALPLNNNNSVTGILPITNGGTGTLSFSSGNSIIATNSANTALMATGINPADLSIQTDTIITTNATPTTVVSLNYPTIAGKAYVAKATVLAKQTTSPFLVASFMIRATFYNNGGILSLVSNANDLVYIPSDITWTANILSDGTNIIIQVTGAVSTNISWKVKLEPILSV